VCNTIAGCSQNFCSHMSSQGPAAFYTSTLGSSIEVVNMTCFRFRMFRSFSARYSIAPFGAFQVYWFTQVHRFSVRLYTSEWSFAVFSSVFRNGIRFSVFSQVSIFQSHRFDGLH
jgi:hypothetical protein